MCNFFRINQVPSHVPAKEAQESLVRYRDQAVKGRAISSTSRSDQIVGFLVDIRFHSAGIMAARWLRHKKEELDSRSARCGRTSGTGRYSVQRLFRPHHTEELSRGEPLSRLEDKKNSRERLRFRQWGESGEASGGITEIP